MTLYGFHLFLELRLWELKVLWPSGGLKVGGEFGGLRCADLWLFSGSLQAVLETSHPHDVHELLVFACVKICGAGHKEFD